MAFSGVSTTNPTALQLLQWGADNGGLVLQYGEWWRLVTSTFVHVGRHSSGNQHVVPLEPGIAGRAAAWAGWHHRGLPADRSRGNLLSIAVNPDLPLGPQSQSVVGRWRLGRGLRDRRRFDPAAEVQTAADAGVRIEEAAEERDLLRSVLELHPGGFNPAGSVGNPYRQHGAPGRLPQRTGPRCANLVPRIGAAREEFTRTPMDCLSGGSLAFFLALSGIRNLQLPPSCRKAVGCERSAPTVSCGAPIEDILEGEAGAD